MTELDLVLAGRWILNAACQKKCKREKFVGRDTAYEELIDDDFEKLKPYHYLQLSYYKASQFVTNYQELIKTKAHQIDYLAKAVQVLCGIYEFCSVVFFISRSLVNFSLDPLFLP